MLPHLASVSSWLKKFWQPLMLLAVIGCIYAPNTNGPYFLDDAYTITTNASVHSMANWTSAFTSGKMYSALPSTWAYRPITALSNILLWSIGDGAPWPFHVFKIFVFFGLCLLLKRIWQELLPNIRPEIIAVSILLFAVNPVHTQVLDYISATSTLLAGFFVCLSLVFYIRFRRSNYTDYVLGLGPSLLAGLVAMLSKEEGIVFCALIPMVEITLRKIARRKLFDKRLFGIIIIYILPALVGVGLLYSMYEPTSQIARGSISRLDYFMTQWRAYIRFIMMYFYSYDLNADNMAFGFSHSLTDPAVTIALFLNVALIGLAIWAWRLYPVFTLALVWFYVGISPASSVVPLAEPVNDHRAFIGYLGFGLIIPLLLNKVLQYKAKTLVKSAIAIVILTYAILTFQRSMAWSSNESIGFDTAAKNPTSSRALNNLAVEYMSQARYSEAMTMLNQCVALGDEYSYCYLNRATTEAALGKDQSAENDFDKASKIDYSKIESGYNWAKFLMARGFIQKPFDILKTTDEFAKGHHLDIRLAMISLLKDSGQNVEAKRVWQDTVSVLGLQPSLQAVAKDSGWQ